jgi:Ser/Thr protein kinase RdoA (MazF antagonist)
MNGEERATDRIVAESGMALGTMHNFGQKGGHPHPNRKFPNFDTAK